MLQHDEPEDFVLATGETQTVRRFAELVFEQLELVPDDFIEIDPRYFRPAEVDLLLGDTSKANGKLGWEATTSLEELARLMVESNLELARQEAAISSSCASYKPASGPFPPFGLRLQFVTTRPTVQVSDKKTCLSAVNRCGMW